MGFFVRAVVTGFALSLGAAIFKKHVQHRLGLDDDKDKSREDDADEALQRQEAGSDPSLDGCPG